MGSTALDFKALLRKEKEKAQRQAKSSRSSFLPFAPRSPLDLDELYRLGNDLSGLRNVAYIPNFLTEEEGQRLLEAIDQVR